MAQQSQIDVSNFVSVQVVITPLAVPYENFGIPVLIGDSGVIDTTQRFRTYTSLIGVGADFGDAAPEYEGSELFFSQSPQPATVMVGAWARVATPGLLHGATLTPTQQLLANFIAVTGGAFTFFIDGEPATVSGLNFSGALNLPGVAALIQTAIQSAFSDTATCTWDANYSRFEFVSGSTGAASSVSYGQAPTPNGFLSFTGNPANNDTVTIGGTAVTFVTSGATGNQVNIGISQSATQTALALFLNASSDTNISKCNYSVVGSRIYIIDKTPGTGGDSFTLTKSSTVIAVSGATLSGGSGTDVSTLLGMTAAAGASAPVIGIAAETPLAALTALAAATSQWYCAIFCASIPPADSDYEACAAFILAQTRARIMGITIINTACLDPTQTEDLASVLQSFNNKRVFWQYSASSNFAVCSMFGRAATINFQASDTTLTLAYKEEPGVQGEYLNQEQFATLVTKGGNVNIIVDNGAIMLWPGQMSQGFWFDEVQNVDWFANEVQTDVFNLLYTTSTKIPQTDPGSEQIANTITGSCEASVNNGMVAPGIWQAAPFGQLNTGDYMDTGYYVYYPPVASQSEATRTTRVSVPFQAGIKLAGAVHVADIILNVNR